MDSTIWSFWKSWKKKIKRLRRSKLTSGVIFHHANSPSKTCALTMSIIHDLGFELLDHPPYSPDIGPSVYDLFLKLKGEITETNLSAIMTSWWQLIGIFDDQTSGFYTKVIERLRHCWTKSVAMTGGHVKKWNIRKKLSCQFLGQAHYLSNHPRMIKAHFWFRQIATTDWTPAGWFSDWEAHNFSHQTSM